MTSSDLITPGNEHRDEIAGLMRVAFNMGAGTLAERAARLPVEKMRCVLEGDRIVAAAGARDFRQWWGGRELEMSGIWGVVTLPEHRGRRPRDASRHGAARGGACARSGAQRAVPRHAAPI
jgi:Acetyltransferase (GNAT) domain